MKKYGMLQVHEIRNYTPSCLNRDESGMPKTAYFGDVYRGRISSQCKKRVMTTNFRQTLKNVVVGNPTSPVQIKLQTGYATKNLKDLVFDVLESVGILDTTNTKLVKELEGKNWFSSFSSGKDVMQKYSWKDVEEIIECTIDKINDFNGSATHYYVDKLSVSRQLDILKVSQTDRKTMTAQDKTNHVIKYRTELYDNFDKLTLADRIKFNAKGREIDLSTALFGRMSVIEGISNVEAAMQVSHAISTNKLRQEVDYFTAVDDLTLNSGSGHLGETNFNSCCYYTYYSIDLDKLADNLKEFLTKNGTTAVDDALFKDYIKIVLSAIYETVPTGKQNSFAANDRPSYLSIELCENKRAMSYANAFVKPVAAVGNTDIVTESVNKLVEETNVWDIAEGFKGHRTEFKVANCGAQSANNAVTFNNINDAIADVLANI